MENVQRVIKHRKLLLFSADSPCAQRPCQNGGVCKDDYESGQQYQCICPVTHEGDNCEVRNVWYYDVFKRVGTSIYY